MMKLFRIESTTEIGDHIATMLVDQNGATSLHTFTLEALERFRGGERLRPWRMQQHEALGALPRGIQQRLEMTMERHMGSTP